MSAFGKRTLLSALLALSLSLLAACGSTLQATPDPINDLATLADSEGNLETSIEIQSVGSGNPQSQAETVHLYFKAGYKGKNLHGFYALPEVGDEVLVNYAQGISAAFAKGDKPQIRGRVRNVGGVPAFVGFMRSQTAGALAAATTPPGPVILLGANKTLPGPTGTSKESFTDLPVSGFVIDLNGGIQIVNRNSSGKPFEAASVRTLDRDAASGLPTGVVFQAKFSGGTEAVQTPIGPIGKVKGTLTYGQNKTVEVQGFVYHKIEL